jgi:prepilin-type processing-associated H-X9-DG protein
MARHFISPTQEQATMRHTRGFTLAKARTRARMLQCLSNVRQIGVALTGYSVECREEVLATRFNISGGSVLAPDNSTYVVPTGAGQGGKWLDIISINYMNRAIKPLECPDQQYTPTRLGYGLNEFVIHYETDYGSFINLGDRPHRLYEFQKPSNKLWMADTGLQNWQSKPMVDHYYGTYIRNWGSANRGYQCGISGRHEMGLNILFFDGHGAYGTYENYNLTGSHYTGVTGDIRAKSYSPGGRRQERRLGCADH